MERYSVLETVGEGTFGTVYRATNKQSGKEFAIKRMKHKFKNWDETVHQREFQAILALSQGSDHIVQIFEIIREQDSRLYFVCEFMPDGDLKDYLARQHEFDQVVDPRVICSILRQVLMGLRHMHSKGFMHRDLKPENLLMRGTTCKVADFSLARSAVICDDESRMTNYVSSRWYRAPEIILESPNYSTAVDMFALGCIMAELHSMVPLFPGRTEMEQLPLILELLGPIEADNWPEGVELVQKFRKGVVPEDVNPTGRVPDRLGRKLPIKDPATLSLLTGLLEINPARRPSVDEALSHGYFCDSSPTHLPSPLAYSSYSTTGTPLKMCSTTEGKRVPFVSVSPRTRNYFSVAGTFFSDSVGDRGPRASCEVKSWQALKGIDTTVQDCTFFSAQDETTCYAHQPTKRIRTEYRPSQAFNVD